MALAMLAGCGSGHTISRSRASADTLTLTSATASPPVPSPPPDPQALVTDERQNRLLVVDLPSGRLVRKVSLPAEPEDIATTGDDGIVVVVSSSAGKVTVLRRATLRPIRTFGGFDQPHIVAISPDRRFAYVTDDVRGTVTAIRLADLKVTSTVSVGSGAHHLSFSPDQRLGWVGLGESAHQISVLDTSSLARPRLVGAFNPGFLAHDLSFSPDGRQVWVSSAAGPDVTVFDAHSHRPLFRVPVGPSPQHIAFAGRYVYLTSGYGGTIERVDGTTGRVITRTGSPYGSFELAAADGFVVASSLLRGTLAIYTPGLRLLRVVRLAPATREVAIARP